MGLVSQVLPDRDTLLKVARQEADSIAALPPLVVQGVKHVLDKQDGMTIAQGLDYVATWNSAFLASEDLGEAFAAFFEKRDPDYKGK
jgi:enoyl-CoA hydratase